ncbi:HAMP domain-containing histidine kinase [Aldersonia sp. NBC_00410]|uniref:sensor histidine kinase n=1 Tax=Aldersonia sp. NBC_00410 TaxID=2975954 RepID=UPI0022556223|nr:HAMP domain-containing sensor histidine kinase [Aldersonia sp. NBC_00410]MCX5044517.1 HAMP domain-containing histidine kinase [Aldersonia sp. NBC_00410]
MRRRILLSILAVVILTTMVLGLPLMYTAWLWVEDITRNDMQDRLDRMADVIIAQEGANGMVEGPLDTRGVEPLVPDGGHLVVVYPTPPDRVTRLDLGVPEVTDPLIESLSMGTSGSLRLEQPPTEMRSLQWRAVGAVSLLVVASMAAGTSVAVVTAKRLSDPLRDVAKRAARLGEGDFRPDPRRHGIAELDRVSDVLDSATVEIASRLQREHLLAADVSHQLRSRLTAVRLRLDELVEHPDPDVVEEAQAAMAQVDRLTAAIDELVRASREDEANPATVVSVLDELRPVVAEWERPFEERGRRVLIYGDAALRSPVTGPRLREAAAVLIDNALVHGGGTCSVRVRDAKVAGRAPRICVEVSDQGAGISDDLAPHIFDRGVSGAGSTGVGLALARALIEADGGRLELRQRKPALFAVFLTAAENGSGATMAGRTAVEPGLPVVGARPRVGEPR